MKQNSYAKLVFLGLITLWLVTVSFVNCEKPNEDPNRKIAEKLLILLDKQLPGAKLKVKPENIIVKSAENKRYWVTFKDSTFTTDLAWIVKFIQKISPADEGSVFEEDTGRVAEMVLLYGPEEKYLNLLSIKGLSVEHDYSKSVGSAQAWGSGDFKIDKIRVSVGNITFNNRDVSDLLGGSKGDFPDGVIMKSVKMFLKFFDSTVEHLNFEINILTKKKETFSFLLDIERISSVIVGAEDPYISVYLFADDAPPPDLVKTLQKGLAITDLKIELGKANISIKKNGTQLDGGVMDNISYSLFIKPNKAKTSFQFGFGVNMKNFESSTPVKKNVESLGNPRVFQFTFNVENVTPGVGIALIDLIKKCIELRDLVDDPKMQEISLQVKRLWNEFFFSNPRIEYSISFKNDFLELSLKANIYRFIPPAARLIVEIFNIEETLTKLKEANLLSPAELKIISETLDKYTVRKANGDASLTIELKPDQPGKYFFNGKSKMIF